MTPPKVSGLFVDGRWLPPARAASRPVVNPYTETEFGSAPIVSPADVDRAVRSAREALEGPWRETTLEERIAVVERMRDLLMARAEEIAGWNSSSVGSLYAYAKGLGNASALIDMYVASVRRLPLEYLRMDELGDALVVRRPVGVVAAIVPWNGPVRAELKKVVPALLTGCTVVLKPAPEAPFGASALVEIAAEAGLPPGVLNLVTGDGSTGAALVGHPLVDKVAFTGSSATGQQIWEVAAPTFKRLQLELGGKSAAVLLDDVDLAEALPWLDQGIFSLSGQMCTATSRVLVPRARYAEVVDALVGAARRHVLGDPFDAATTMGPLVADRQRERVLGYVDIGRGEGARVATGGGPSTQPRGYFVEPTVLADVDNGMRVAREEIFGPVVCVIPYGDEDEAIRIANDSEYGLGGAVHSADPARALATARRIDSGFVSVNRYRIPDSAPLGGVRRSGIGREHGVEGFDSFLEYTAHPVPHELAVELSATVPQG